MPKWTSRDQAALRSRRDQTTYQEAESRYTASDRFYRSQNDTDRLADARARGTNDPDDPGTLHQYRDPNIGTVDWYADKGLQPPEPWIERIEHGSNAEGFQSVVVDGKTGDVLEDTRQDVDMRDQDWRDNARVGTIKDSSESE